jgi:hypothetical protein
MEATQAGDDGASIAAWLRRENSNLLKQVRQLKQALKTAETTASGGVDVEALRQKLGLQARELERLTAELEATAPLAAELSNARDRVVTLQDRLEEAETEAAEAQEAVAEMERRRQAQQEATAAQDSCGEQLRQLEGEYADFKAKAKAAVKQQRDFKSKQKTALKEQAAVLKKCTVELAASERAVAEGAAAGKTLAALREEYALVDQQREEQARRAGEAEQKRSVAVAEVVKLQQQAESWQQQRKKALAKYALLKETSKKQREQIKSLQKRQERRQQQQQEGQEQGQEQEPPPPPPPAVGVAVAGRGAGETTGAAMISVPPAQASAMTDTEAEAEAEAEEDGLFGDEMEQEYLLAQGGVQEYIFSLERERRAEQEAADFQLMVYMERCTKLQTELDTLRPRRQHGHTAAAAASPSRSNSSILPIGLAVSSGGGGAAAAGSHLYGSLSSGQPAGATVSGEAVALLREVMGCTEEDAFCALRLTHSSQERAVELLLGGAEALQAAGERALACG